VALRIRATSPIYCGRCGKRRGLVHTCIVRRANGRTKVKAPRVMLASCPSCGKPYANPLTHVCPGRPAGDFKRRRAAAERSRKAEDIKRRKAETAGRRRARAGRPQHRYETCNDTSCPRLTCRAWKEGYLNGLDRGLTEGEATGRVAGYAEGHRDGHAEGHREGYKEGYRDGLAAAARTG
jgi:hypothetical protein